MREETLLGTGFLLVATRSADCCVELVFFDSVEQGSCLQAVAAGIVTRLLPDAPRVDRLLHGADDQLRPEAFDQSVAIGDCFTEIVPGIDVQQRKWNPSRIKGLVSQMGNDYRVLAAGEQDDRTFELFRHLTQHVDGFRLQLFKMR